VHEESVGSSRQRRPPTRAQRSLLLLVSAVVILVDQASKWVVEQQLPLHSSWAPLPGLDHLFRITHLSNTGAAFGLFPGGSLLFSLIAALVAIVILYYNFQLPAGNHLLRFALGLQLGGALGNLVDRLRIGHVTDFLDFGRWPVFNLADAAIVGGVVLLALLMLVEERAAARAKSSAEPSSERPAASGLSTLEQTSNHEPSA
jgi:signal peptidase II